MRGYVHIYHTCLTLFVGGLQKCGWERENGLKMGENHKKSRIFFDKWLHNYKMDML